MQLITDIGNKCFNYNDYITLKCQHCQQPFERWWKYVKRSIKTGNRLNYCGIECQRLGRRKGKIYHCSHCNKCIYRTPSDFKSTVKSNRVFCSSSCAAIYNNTHKSHGYRRSKIEIYLESQLKSLFPKLEILFNDKEIINSELDIYLPSLKLAFELNGVFHYEPIYGKDKLNQIINNDNRKFQACLEKGIELCIIDISNIHHFKPILGDKFLKIIQDIINSKLHG